METVAQAPITGARGLDQLARELARTHALGRRRARHLALRRHVDALARRLKILLAGLNEEEPATRTVSAEWLLDNYHILSEALSLVRHDLGRGFLRELPVLEGDSPAFATRISTLAAVLVAEGAGRVDPDRARRFLDAYQSVSSLSTAELWAFPAVVRLALIQDLVESGEALIAKAREQAEKPHTATGGQVRVALDDRIAGGIGSLRLAAALDWKAFFESVSRVERTLSSLDPVDVYAGMDFETRDRYRKAVEELARQSGETEAQVALRAVELARQSRDARKDVAGTEASRGEAEDHVGFYLLDEGRPALERRLGSVPPLSSRAARWLGRRGVGLYLTSLAILSVVALVIVSAPLVRIDTLSWPAAFMVLFALVPATTLAISLVQWIVARTVKPEPVPKMDFSRGIPESATTAVVVPCLLTDRNEIGALARQLELNYGGNRDPRIQFVLLADFVDASSEVMPEDEDLLAAAVEEVRGLNRRYGQDGQQPFALLLRPREWNASEGCWMGWERKRGKLTELERLILGSGSGSFSCPVGDLRGLEGVRYVITLDADTFLPQTAAQRLVGALAHPLNVPHFDSRGRLHRGYTVLQPRIETFPGTDEPTWFSKIYEVDRGLDLYSQVVSDVYQDLFGTGIYAGKGIYDVAAFHRSLEGQVPENALLSHDLFEGVHGRAALVTDIAVFEDFPTSVLTFMRRLHRWVRGDWQIARWLLPSVQGEHGGRIPNPIDLLGRWQIADNLRRSLLTSSLLLFLVVSWLSPSPWWWWGTASVAAVLGLPVLLGAAGAVRARFTRKGAVLSRSGPLGLFRWGLSLAFLPHQAVVEGDAIARTLGRLTVTRRHLLEWTSASVTSRAVGGERSLGFFAKRMAPATVLAAGLAGLVGMAAPDRLPAVGPILLAWLLAPVLAWWVSQPIAGRQLRRRPSDDRAQRRLARRTWAYFERLLGPDHHWLPPDNLQEHPGGNVAPRTSPTNIGLGLLSTLAAWDFGYLTSTGLLATLSNTFEGIEKLETHRGHLLNWYETRILEPLAPRYVSTVDSGNLAAALITLDGGLAALQDVRLPRRSEISGFVDTLRVVQTAVAKLPADLGEWTRPMAERIEATIESLSGTEPRRAALRVLDASGDLETRLGELVEKDAGNRGGVLHEIREWLLHLREGAEQTLSEIDELMPWIEATTSEPTASGSPEAWSDQVLHGSLPTEVSLRELPDICEGALEALRTSVVSGDGVRDPEGRGSPDDAQIEVEGRLERAARAARGRLDNLQELRARGRALSAGMDFSFLYDASRRLFHIGYNVTTGTLDGSYYDLLASEARLASFVAIAKRDVPSEHWLHLGRPFGRAGHGAVLLSWAGTMFEYLMPRLLMRMPPHSLLAVSCQEAVDRQIRFARKNRVPWGISESAYYELDDHGTYQYRAFGVPDLGLRRDLGDRLVVAPYASILALPLDPGAVVDNVETLEGLGATGQYGLYEALDFGASDEASVGSPRIVRSYMAHHQGMILVALDNLLNGDLMPQRFHADPRTAAPEFLLYERAPGHVRIEPLAPLAPLSRRSTAGLPPLESWPVSPREGGPDVQILSNGHLSALVTATGAGALRWGPYAATRWHADLTADPWGHWLYLQDMATEALWSACDAPVWKAGRVDVSFAPHEAEFHTLHEDLSSRMAVTVPPGSDVEIRRVTLINDRAEKRRLHVTNYAEVSLAPPEEDGRHPAFAKLFVESRFDPALEALVYHRRRASPQEPPIFLAHAVAYPRGTAELVAWETDRERFLGRNGDLRRPASIRVRQKTGAGASGFVLDPVMSFTLEVDVRPNEEVELVYLTAVGRSEEDVLAALDAYRTPAGTAWAFQRARVRAQKLLHELEIHPSEARRHQRLLSALLHPYHPLRGRPSRFPDRMPQQQGLWALGISGDLPLLVVRAGSVEETGVLLEAVKAYALWREQNVAIELAVVDEGGDSYRRPLEDWLRRTLRRLGREAELNRSRGVHYLPAGRLDPLHRATLEEAAAVVLDADLGDLEAHLARLHATPHDLPPFVPVPTGAWATEPTAPLPQPEPLEIHNGLGGFTSDGSEYRLRLDPGATTPAPWINVVATPTLGFIVSEAGSGFTWVGNSGESRLTTWSNDPVLDRSGEAIYVRDEETAEYWSPTPQPRPGGGDYEVRHGAGYSTFLHRGQGLHQRVELFASHDPPAKVVELELENAWSRHRRLTVTYYAEWVLGSNRARSAAHLETAFAADGEILLARDLFSELEEAGVAFLASDQPMHGWTTDRREFLGLGGTLARPAALERIGLDQRSGRSVDPCAALQIHVDLAPGETRTVRFFLGWAVTVDEVRQVVSGCRAADAVADMKAASREFWDGVLSRVTVHTPEPAMDILLNRWLLYQALSCRLWGRSALYQSSGAFGFRDQLQDSLAFSFVHPETPRERILDAASRQFPEGDVLHWWHPPSGRGVRTRCSDDLLWLPYATAAYVTATGDQAILDRMVPYLVGAPLAEGEQERYGSYAHGEVLGHLYEHCLRAIDRASTEGPNGLPLIGSGDWNDALDRVGAEGRGESVWLAWFLYATLLAFAEVADARDDGATAHRLRERAEEIRRRVEAFAWDGRWYVRATYDDGGLVGSSRNDEDRIDAISQAWSVLSGGGAPARTRQAMNSVWTELVREDDGLVLLLTPPFDRTVRWPGYIKAYPPGVRENGGQYTHAALWTAWAYASLGDGDRAGRCFQILNPALKSRSWQGAQRYRVEPYVVAADVYSVPPHVGRGGWTWYTGSAAWMWRLGTEAILGLRPVADGFVIDPCIPSHWPGYTMVVRVGATTHRIEVDNPEHVCRGVERMEFDGVALPSNRFRLRDDGQEHRIDVRLGKRADERPEGVAPRAPATGVREG